MNASARGASATVLEETRKETAPVQLPVSGPELAAMMKIGTRVMRGVDWKWGDQVLRDLVYYFGYTLLLYILIYMILGKIGIINHSNSGHTQLIDE